MKSLALYIDKWYIVGAINIDGITRPVNLPNHEDRIWLYFYEDVANDEISYGKGFQSKYRNNEPHYYGDVFSLITQSSAKYTMFKRPQDMKGIFKSAKIFDDLRRDIDEDGDIITYVSFSKDISLASRLLFLEELKNDRFDVKESVARIGHLALEYAAKKNNYTENGYYLVLNACNENLHYSVYQKSDDLFNRVKEEVLSGMGTDVRSRALIEHVVDNINEREHFLKTKEERESEYLRMNQFVDDWLIKLSSARSFIPIQLTNVTFSRDPYKDYSVQVKKSKIDERTDRIVRDIINVIVRFVKDADVSHEQLKGILFLGNTFTNAQFKKELRTNYNLSNNQILNFLDTDLPSLVHAYLYIDSKIFVETTKQFYIDAKKELEEIKQVEETSPINVPTPESPRPDISRKFNEVMDLANDAKRKGDFEESDRCVNIALTLKPDDEEALLLLKEIKQKIIERDLLEKQYKEKLCQAKSSFDEGDYETAKYKADEALNLKPESKEASRIKEDSIRRLKSQKELERYLDRADLFIAQKAFSEAIEELSMARHLDVDDQEISIREEKIHKEQEAANLKISELKNNLNLALNDSKFEEALSLCNELIEVDFVNSRKWNMHISEIEKQKEQVVAQKERWNKLVREIDSLLLSEAWDELYYKCEEALNIAETIEIREKYEKAKNKVGEKKGKFDACILEATEAFKTGKWQDVINKCNVALELFPNSPDVRQLLKTAQESYEKGIINDLIEDLNKAVSLQKFEDAIDLCSKLARNDSANSDNWLAKKQDLQNKLNSQREILRELNELRKEIDNKHLNQEWVELKSVCEKYLKVQEDNHIRELSAKAQEQIVLEEIQQEFDCAYEDSNWQLILTLSKEHPILKRTPANNRVIKEAMIKNRKKMDEPSDREKPRPPIRKPQHTPLTLLPEPDVNIEINNKPSRPHIKRIIQKNNISQTDDVDALKNDSSNVEENQIKDTNNNSTKRKFPKVKRNKN